MGRDGLEFDSSNYNYGTLRKIIGDHIFVTDEAMYNTKRKNIENGS